MHRMHNHGPDSEKEEAALRDSRRRRYESVLQLIEKWGADRTGYEERVWPDLVRHIEANRLSPRERFRD